MNTNSTVIDIFYLEYFSIIYNIFRETPLLFLIYVLLAYLASKSIITIKIHI